MAAQICYWDNAGGDEDWSNAGNWETENETDRVPLANDLVVFDDRMETQEKPEEGMLDSESGAAAQCTYDLLHFKKGWTDGVGLSTEPLCCAPDKIIIDGTGTYHIMVGQDDQSSNVLCPLVIVNNKAAIVYLYSNCNSPLNRAEFTDVIVLAGTVHLSYYSEDSDNCGCSVANLYLAPTGGKASNVTVTIAKDCYDVLNSTPTNIYMQNGTLTTDSQVGTFEVYDGTVNYGTDLVASPETDLNITTLRLYDGTFNWLPDDSGDDAYIGDLYIFGGTFNASSATNNDRAKALGNGAGNDIYLFEGGSLNIANGRGNITIAASSQLWNLGGVITVDDYAQLAVTYNQP